MLELARGVGLGVNVGNFLEFEGSLQRRGVIDIAADEVHVARVEILGSKELNILLVLQHFVNLLRQLFERRDVCTELLLREFAELLADVQRQKINDRKLRAVCFCGRDGNFRACPRIQHVVRFGCNGAADNGVRLPVWYSCAMPSGSSAGFNSPASSEKYALRITYSPPINRCVETYVYVLPL